MEIRIVEEPSLIGTISVIVSVVSVIVLTTAAVVAYFIQRSRFLKELQPDITVDAVECMLSNDHQDPRLIARITVKNSGRHEAYLQTTKGYFMVLPASLTSLDPLERVVRQWPSKPHPDPSFFRILPHLVRDIALVFEVETPLEELREYHLQLDFNFEFESGRQALLYLLFKPVVKKAYSLNLRVASDWPNEEMAVNYPWFT